MPKHRKGATFARIFNRAKQAGILAGDLKVPEPVIVQMKLPGKEKKRYNLREGLCGFAWVFFKVNGESGGGFVNWLMVGKEIDKYEDGFRIWISEHGQSYERKMAHAKAMAQVLSFYSDTLGIYDIKHMGILD